MTASNTNPDAVVRVGADHFECFDNAASDLISTETAIGEIFSEYLACRWLSSVEIDHLTKNGIAETSLVFDTTGRHFKLAATPVAFLSGGYFEFKRYCPDVDGCVTAVIVVCRDQIGDVADIAAWVPATGQLAVWRGRVAVLGEHQIFAPRLGGEPLRVHPTPMEWLRDCRQGVVIINQSLARPLLQATSPLGVHEVEFGQRLRQVLTTPPPRIHVARRQNIGRAA